MTRNRSHHTSLSMLCGAILLAFAGCATDSGALEAETGSLSLDVTIAGGFGIDEVAWTISGGDMPDMSGAIDTSAPGSTASVEVFGIPEGTDYVIDMQATSTDGELTCEGSGTFDIEVGTVTDVPVMLNCEQPPRFGAVRVDGTLNLCAELTKVLVSPLQTSVGGRIDLQSAAIDEEGDAVAYLWTSGRGRISDPTAANTIYACTEAGDDQITITVSDDGFDYCAREWTVKVRCAATIYATGQLLVPGNPDIPFGEPGHDDTRENFVYAIDPATGAATPVSPATTGLPAALAGEGPSRLLGFASGQLVEIAPTTGAQTPIGENNELNATGLDVTADGRGFLLPFNDDFDTQQLHGIDLETGDATPIGSLTAVGDAIDLAAGNEPGTSRPFVIGLSSIDDNIYGVDLDSSSLIEIDSEQGSVSVVGDVGAVGSVGGGAFSGFAAMTGVDEDADGEFDALFGNVNFFDDDGDPETPSERLGGVARYDLEDGTWSLVGTNPGVIFFGFASNPAPTGFPPDSDGTIVFVSERTGNDELYAMDVDGTEVEQLTDTPGPDRAPTWDFPGEQLVFNSQRAPHEDQPELYRLDFAARETTRITDDPLEDLRGAWTPDGSAVVFQRGTFFTGFGLWQHELATGSEELVISWPESIAAAPSVSPNGARLVFQSNHESTEIFPFRLYILELATGEVEPFFHAPTGSDDGPRWSPDGTRITFSSSRGDSSSLYVADLEIGQLEQVTDDGGWDIAPAWSPDGNRLVFQSDRVLEDGGVHIVDLRSGELSYLGEGRTPAWSSFDRDDDGE